MSTLWSAVHAGVLISVTLALSAKLTRTTTLFEPPTAQPELTDSDLADLKRLNEAMAQGIFKEEGLKVGKLASHLGLTEHRLRFLINQQMGFRNSFKLFEHRAHRLRKGYTRRILVSLIDRSCRSVWTWGSHQSVLSTKRLKN